MLRELASLAAPPLCAICAGACEPADTLCSACERKVARLEPQRTTLPGGTELISAAPYEGIAQDLVRRLKFSSRLALAEVAAERMTRAWGATRDGWLVPVPAAPARERARGFDDAAMLARLVAKHCPAAHVVELLAREDGPRQVRRSRGERIADPPKISVLGKPSIPSRENLWLVDDVATTGATLTACALALRLAGAERVRALTFARADS